MNKFNVDLILHPVRMRILVALSGKQLTAQSIGEALHDVPQATLYRHIQKLAKAGVITVAAERPVRGTVEKVYALRSGAANLDPQSLSEMDKDEHMHLFIGFIASLLDDFARYLHTSEQVDYLADGVGYRKVPIELTDEEFRDLAAALNQAFLQAAEKPPVPGRKRRLFSTIVMPDVDG